nr:unnamed protein product [Spirometra erinaceieuropaei]
MSSTNSNDPTSSLSGLVSSLPDFWQHAPELYFFRIEATFHSAKITRETDKFYKLVEALPPTILSQVQTLLRDPPTDAPYTKLKAELLRLTSVSDRQRYHALVKEKALGDRKPSELLRRMRSLVGNMKIDDKFFKEMFLERLPTSVQTILASGSDDLEISKLAEMADRMMEVERLSSPTIAQVSQPLNVSTSDLAELKTQIAQLSATVAALQLRRFPGPSRRPFGRDRRRSRSRPRTANLCWYHVNYGDKARRCVPPCSFKSTQGNSSAGDRDVEEHLHHLTLLFDRFQQFGVTLHPSKCVLGATSLEFLGHLIDSNGIRPLPSKVAAIRDFPPPTSKRQLQRFLGMVNFYRRFLPNCADTILPLTDLLSGPKRTFELTSAALTSFEQVKDLLADATLLTHFHADAPISLMVDASNVAVGAVLQQSLPDSTVPLAFFSKKLSKAETRYSTFGRELLAAYLAVRHFRHLLEGREFTIFTDHKPLTFAMHSHSDKLSPREIRHLDYISQFTSDIRHIDGSRNEVADALSRPSIAHLQLSPGIDLAEMAAEQRRVGPPCDEDVSGLQLQELPLTTGNGTILCDVSTPSHRPFVPPSLRRKVFSSLHNLSHPGSRATDKLVSDRFVWPAELVFGSTVRLPGEMISPTPQGTVEDPTNLLHRLRQFMRTLSPVPPRSSASPSYLEKDLATCSHVYLRCDRVRRPLEPPYDGPFRVLSRGPKTFRIQRDNREEVVSVDRLKAVVPDTPPDEPCGPQPSPSPQGASIPPSRIFPLPSCPPSPTATTNSNTSATRFIHSSTDPVNITRSGRHVHFPDRLVTHFF